MARFVHQLLIICFVLTGVACAAPTETPVPSAIQYTATPSSKPATATLVPTQTRLLLPTRTPEPVDTGWMPIAPGFERRSLSVDTSAGRERLRLVRFRPEQARLRVAYQPTHPRTISEWAAALPGALVVANAGYFTPENRATGVIVSDGISSGRTYGSFAGMLAVSPDGQMTLRWLQTWPFRTDERLAQAVQSFPVLVKPGGMMGFPPDADDGQVSRRTVIAQDRSGRFVLIISPGFRFNLHELAMWLTNSDLDLDIALNLDGGTSSGLWIQDDTANIDSFVPVPAVIAIEPLT